MSKLARLPLALLLGCGSTATPLPSTHPLNDDVAEAAFMESMVAIPTGHYALGSHAEVPSDSDRWVAIEAFSIDDREVTVADYTICVEAAGCTTPTPHADLERMSRFDDSWDELAAMQERRRGWCNYGVDGQQNHPINCITYAEAEAFCDWRQARLPTAAEWMVAAHGPENVEYPWGESPPTPESGRFCDAECARRDPYEAQAPESAADARPTGTAPVKTHPPDQSGFGARDLFGNVREWTRDYAPVWHGGGGMPLWQGGYPLGERDGPLAVVGGAGFLSSEYLGETMRHGASEWRSLRLADVGFRCARSAAPTPADVPRGADLSTLSPELRAAAGRGQHSISSRRRHAVLPIANLDAFAGSWTLEAMHRVTVVGSASFTEVLTVLAGSTGAMTVAQELSPGGCPVTERHRLAFFSNGAELRTRYRDSEINVNPDAGGGTDSACALYNQRMVEDTPNPNDAEGHSFGTVREIATHGEDDAERLVLRTDRGTRTYRRLAEGALPATVQGTVVGPEGVFASGNSPEVVLGASEYDQRIRIEFAVGGRFEASLMSTFMHPAVPRPGVDQEQCFYDVRWSGTWTAAANAYRLRPRRASMGPFETFENPDACPARPLSNGRLMRLLREPDLTQLRGDGAGRVWLTRSHGDRHDRATMLSLQ